MSGGVDIAINHVGSQDVAGIGVRITEKIGESDGGERIIVGKIILKELHCGIKAKALGTMKDVG